MPLPVSTAERLLNHLNGHTPLNIIAPLRLYVGNQSTSVGPQPITFSLGVRDNNSSGEDGYFEAVNTSPVVFPNMPPIIVNRWFILDSSPTPVAIWEDRTVRVRDVPQGDSYEVPAGALKVRMIFYRAGDPY